MLWIPGPTEVRPEILAACAEPVCGHRSAAMMELIERIDPHLPRAFGLDAGSGARFAVANCSASGLMESALLGVEGRVLSIVNGAFSRRWLQIARSLGLQAVELEVEWGRGVDGDVLAATLEREGPFDAVTLVANETSTGVHTPLGPVADVLSSHEETLLLVDVVSLIAGAPVDFDRNRVDFMLAGVQKAFALPPGIAVYCVSQAYVERARRKEHRGWALDPLRTLEGHEARKTPATPCVSLYRALAKQLEDITAAGWEARFAKHAAMRDRTLAWAAGHGLEPFPAEGFRSPTVSCIRADGIDVAALTAGLAERGYEISNGYGPLKGETFRIGHMGDHTPAGLEELLAAADAVLATAS